MNLTPYVSFYITKATQKSTEAQRKRSQLPGKLPVALRG